MSDLALIQIPKGKRARSKTEQLQKKKHNRELRLQHMQATGIVRRVPLVAGQDPVRANLLIPRPGPIPIQSSMKRVVEVRAAFNDHELLELDIQRKAAGFNRAQWLRMCWLRTIPIPKIPTINIQIINVTANISSNLIQLSRKIDDAAVLQCVELASRSLDRFRKSLSQYVEIKDKEPVPLNFEDRSARRGPDPIPPSEVRKKSISVALTAEEFKKLEAERGKSRMGEWLRMCWQNIEPTSRVPTMSKSEFDVIGKTAIEINSIARDLNSNKSVNNKFIIDTLANFRIALRKLEGALR